MEREYIIMYSVIPLVVHNLHIMCLLLFFTGSISLPRCSPKDSKTNERTEKSWEGKGGWYTGPKCYREVLGGEGKLVYRP